MANNKTADVLLKFSVDTASVNRVRASFNALDTELDSHRKQIVNPPVSGIVAHSFE